MYINESINVKLIWEETCLKFKFLSNLYLIYFTFIAINKKIFKRLVSNISYDIALGFKFVTFV